MPNKQQFLDIMNFQENGGVPAAFWFHFSPYDKLAYQVGQKDLWNNLIKEHQKYLRKVPNGIIKVMSDGYFTTPAAWDIDVRDPKALSSLKPTAQSHPWFEEQIELCRQVAASAEDTLVYYTVFSPLTTLFFSYWGRENGNDSDDIFSPLLSENTDALQHALEVCSADITLLVKRLLEEGGADGIYYSVRTFPGISAYDYRAAIAASDCIPLNAANAIKNNQILHICGFSGAASDLELYSSYTAKVYNWSVRNENVSLAEGRKIFAGKTILGGFDNAQDGLLNSGSKVDIEKATEKLVKEAGRKGLILGADCTLPNEIAYDRLRWVQEKAASL